MTLASKIIITIISIITVLAILAGVFLHVVKGFSFGSGVVKTAEGTIELEGSLSEIILDADHSEITVKTGSEFSVSYCVPEALEPKVELKNGTLTVNSHSTGSLNLVSLGNVHYDNYITIIIPEDSELARVSVDVDAGEINLNNLDVSKLQLTADAGNIQMDSITSNRMEIDVDAGNIEIRDSSADTMEIDADAGNVELFNSTIGTLTADVDAGNIESHDCTIESGRCDADLGNINLRGDIGDVSTHTSLGSASTDKKSA